MDAAPDGELSLALDSEGNLTGFDRLGRRHLRALVALGRSGIGEPPPWVVAEIRPECWAVLRADRTKMRPTRHNALLAAAGRNLLSDLAERVLELTARGWNRSAV